MKSVRLVVVATVALFALAAGGCGTGGGSYDTSPSPAPPSTPGSGASPTTPGMPKGGAVELRGKVEAGVEANCLILRTDGKTYNLVGGDKKVVKNGARVVVRGTEKPDMVTTCMQGIPFEVSDAKPQ